MKTARAVVGLFFCSCVWSQTESGMPGQAVLTKILTFEDEHTDAVPKGWTGPAGGIVSVDNSVVHSGKWSVRIERTAENAQPFTTVTYRMPVGFAGNRVELKGWMRTQDVAGFAAFWMRQDGDGPLAFDSLQNRDGGIKGTSEWTEYTLSLPVHAEAQQLYFGFLVSGAGKAWADDLQLLVDGKPVWDAPKRQVIETVITKDHEFDAGSKISVTELSPVQVQNVALLGRVWGFLKYHHPRVTAGELHWDYELFRVAPAVLAAADAATAQKAVLEWVKRTGIPEKCSKDCAKLEDSANVHLKPPVEWLNDTKLLGTELSATLGEIYRNRSASGKHFYLKLAPGVGNPLFQNEPAYGGLQLPDAGYQMLGLFRYWNMIEYWFPYRDLIGEDWGGVLREFVPRIILARTRDDYTLQFMALIARVHDTHANLWSSLQLQPPVGTCSASATVRFVEGKAVVSSGNGEALRRGDIIESVDGTPVAELVKRWSPYYAASNEPTRLRDIGRNLLRGECAETALKVRREGQVTDVKVMRVKPTPIRTPRTHDLAGETFRKLSPEIAYLKLSTVKAADAAKYVKQAEGSKGLIIDIRNYPSEFMVFALGSLLVDESTPFAAFTAGDLRNPGAFRMGMPVFLQPSTPKYEGKVVVLIDEVSQSQAEYTSMAFRASKRTKVVGSTTAGADGNVSTIPLPGGLRTMISGIGVFYPDGRGTQRTGIVPDVEVQPTIAGITAGRDEVLEAAVRLIAGPEMPAAEIEKITRPPQ